MALPIAAVILVSLGCATGPGSSDGSDNSTTTSPDASADDGSQSLPANVFLVRQADTWQRPIAVPIKAANNYIFVRAQVNDTPAEHMLLDMGSALTGIETGLANRLKLEPAGFGMATGIGGAQRFTWYSVESLALGRLGQIRLDERRVAGLRLPSFRKTLDVACNGLIGFNSLRHVPFTIDQHVDLLTMYPTGYKPKHAIAADRHKLFVWRNLPMVEATLPGGGKIMLILDTGADNTLTLPKSLLEQMPEITAVDQTGPSASEGIGGTVTTTRTWLQWIDILGVRLKHIDTTFEPDLESMSRHTMPIGRIGNKLLAQWRLTFDAPSNAIYAQWLPAKTQPQDTEQER